MGKETDENIPTVSESKLHEEAGPNREPLKELDARDLIEPLKTTPDSTDDQQQDNELEAPEGRADEEQEITLDGTDGQIDSSPEIEPLKTTPDYTDDQQQDNELEAPEGRADEEQEITLDGVDGQIDSSPEIEPLKTTPDSTDDQQQDNELEAPEGRADEEQEITLDGVDGQIDSSPEIEPLKTTPDSTDDQQQDNELEAPEGRADEEQEITLDGVDGQIDSDPENVETETLPDQNDVQTNGHSDLDDPTQQKSDKNENDLVALDDDEIDDGIDETPAKEETSVTAKILIAALIVLMISGVFIYTKLSLTGIKEKVEPVPEAKSQIREPVEAPQIQTPKPKPPGEYDKYLAKLEEADRLREELLEKKEEIYKLKLHYRNGIAELMDQVSREIQEAGISSYAQALENKRIELILRTIQRRQVYIKELEKPDRWLHNGSEELLFLKRKAQLDLQMVDIAGGINLNRHLRYINAAIQKYQPSAEKLAVAPPPADLRPLETIWNKINNQQMNKAATALGHKDGNIIEEICSGNFKHITELSVITTMAARCLSKNNGSDLFLNGLTQLSPDEARYLFQWQGNWICLNSVKKLAPAAAKYLFEWEGNWISLNGLTEFPPELALYLMEWRGSQLELMGLSYDKKKPDPRALKYLALWETMGGKLFVSEGIRKEMKRVM